MKKNRISNGFTLIEVTISLAIMATVVGTIVGSMVMSMDAWKREDMRSQLRHSVEKGVERFKEDVRLTDASRIVYYPSGDSTYTAISMPYFSKDASGFFPLSGGAVDWSQAKTVIYHVQTADDGQKELVRTVYNTFNTSSSARQTQLDTIAVDGSDNANGSTDYVLAKATNVSLSITPSQPTFDGYASSTQLSGLTNFGSAALSAGTHQIKFLVTGKNSASSGYRMGIDSINISPSGGLQEAEALTVAASSGQTQNVENMTSYGEWGGNYQVEYQSSSTDQYITFSTYYDQWLESNFAAMTHNNTMVSGTNPSLTLLSREEQSAVPAWTASAETAEGDEGSGAYNTQTARVIVSGANFTKGGTMMRLKFTASPSYDLVLGPVYFGLRSGSTPNFSASPQLLYFDNSPATEGDSDPVGATANPGTRTSLTVPAGQYVWSNWFVYPTTTGSVPDFLVSMYVSSGSGTVWTPNPAATTGYHVSGDQSASMSDWTTLGGYATDTSLFAVSEVATWTSTGTATSQVYDTKINAPNYSQIAWTPTLPAGSSVSFKVRTSDSIAMEGASDWATLGSYSSSPGDLSSLTKKRYLQFQATLTAGSPYTSFPSVDNVTITWPGSTTIVQIGGYYTKRPNYGKFKVQVDGSDVKSALDVGLTVQGGDRGKTFTHTLHSQASPRNTGK